MNPTTILSELESVNAGFRDTLLSFSPEDFNRVPFTGSWTAAQVGAHVLMSSGTMLPVLTGRAQKNLRDPSENIAGLRNTFLDFTTKFESPEIIRPKRSVYDQQQLTDDFRKMDTDIRQAAASLPLDETCLDSPPELGTLTRTELLHFMLFHTQRHLRQLEKIRDHLEKKMD